MSKVYYQGKAFPYKVIGDIPGQRWYMLYENNVLRHFVEEHNVEKRSICRTPCTKNQTHFLFPFKNNFRVKRNFT